MEPDLGSSSNELAMLESLRLLFGPAPSDETWSGDDAAVLDVTSVDRLLVSTDALVEGVHFDRTYSTMEDVGAKAIAVNVSDIAAMGGIPRAAVVAVAGASGSELRSIAIGAKESSQRWRCPIVGGNLSAGRELSVTVTVLGAPQRTAVLRSGARSGQTIFVTGLLGSASAGLRRLREDRTATGADVDRYRRPSARVEEGQAAARAGATAMIDVSDGFAIDLYRLATSSGVGVEISDVPVAEDASEEDALRGDDYELIFVATDADLVRRQFDELGLLRPIEVGRTVTDPRVFTFAGRQFEPTGYLHGLS